MAGQRGESDLQDHRGGHGQAALESLADGRLLLGDEEGLADWCGGSRPRHRINTSDETWDWDAKIAGTYILPAEILASATYHHTSGDAFARQVRFTGGRTIPTIILNVDPIGTYRRPNVALVNFRLEKRFTLPRAQIATVTLNLYNALTRTR